MESKWIRTMKKTMILMCNWGYRRNEWKSGNPNGQDDRKGYHVWFCCTSPCVKKKWKEIIPNGGNTNQCPRKEGNNWLGLTSFISERAGYFYVVGRNLTHTSNGGKKCGFWNLQRIVRKKNGFVFQNKPETSFQLRNEYEYHLVRDGLINWIAKWLEMLTDEGIFNDADDQDVGFCWDILQPIPNYGTHVFLNPLDTRIIIVLHGDQSEKRTRKNGKGEVDGFPFWSGFDHTKWIKKRWMTNGQIFDGLVIKYEQMFQNGIFF